MNLISGSKVVAVFLGTKSSLGDFVLAGKGKPCDCIVRPRPEDIFDVPVYIFTHSCDSMLNSPFTVNFENVSTTKTVGGIDFPCSNVLREIALECGRRLWRQYDDFATAMDVAQSKLLGDDEIAEVMRTGSSVVPQDAFAHHLVLSGLATLIHVDVDGSRCFIEYVPEPILSNTARIHLTKMRNFNKSLAEYVKRLQAGVFHETGAAGEQVGTIVLLRLLDLVVLHPLDADPQNVNLQDSSFSSIMDSTLTGSRNARFGRALARRLRLIKTLAPFSSKSSVPLRPKNLSGAFSFSSSASETGSTVAPSSMSETEIKIGETRASVNDDDEKGHVEAYEEEEEEDISESFDEKGSAARKHTR
jgi:hypothetical protein